MHDSDVITQAGKERNCLVTGRNPERDRAHVGRGGLQIRCSQLPSGVASGVQVDESELISCDSAQESSKALVSLLFWGFMGAFL